jgi:hypothetical protein
MAWTGRLIAIGYSMPTHEAAPVGYGIDRGGSRVRHDEMV